MFSEQNRHEGGETPLYYTDELPKRPARHADGLLGSARLASLANLSQWEDAASPAAEQVSLALTPLVEVVENGSRLAAFPYRGISISGELLDRHTLALGTTGSGKTLRFIAQMVFSLLAFASRTLVILNAKGAWFTRVVAALAQRFRPQSKLNILNPTDPARSIAWNVAGSIKTPTDSFRVSSTLIEAAETPGSRSDSPFWKQASIELLAGMLDTSEVKSLADAWVRARLGPAQFAEFAKRHPHVVQLQRFASYLASGSHNAETIMQDLSNRLAAAGVIDERIRAVTSAQNELDLSNFITRGGDILIIELNEHEAFRLRPLTNVLFTELTEAILQSGDCTPSGRLRTSLAIVADEFASSIGRIPDFEVKINTLRSRGAAVIAATQSISQIDLTYGLAAKPLLGGFNSLITLGALSESDRAYVSQKSGTITVRQWNATEELDPHSGEWLPKTRTEAAISRALILPSDLVRDPHPVFGPLSTVFLPDRPPLLCHLTAAWEIPAIEDAMRVAEEGAVVSGRQHRLEAKPLVMPAELCGPTQGVSPQPPGISNTAGWTDDRLNAAIDAAMKKLEWDKTTGSARKWWEAFRQENAQRAALVLRLAEELVNRKATATEFFLSYVYSGTDSIQGNLLFLDFARLKKEEEKKKREAAQKAKAEAPAISIPQKGPVFVSLPIDAPKVPKLAEPKGGAAC